MEKAEHRTRVLEELDLLEKPKVSEPASRRYAFCFWKWKVKALRFLDGFRRRGSHCLVCLQVHQIDGLPSAMDGRALVVGWKTKGCKGEHTLPVHVCGGVASFDEIFLHYCVTDVQSMLGSFAIWASLVDAADCDLGTFHVDSSEFAAATEDSNSAFAGKTMSFVLGGVAGGGALRLSVYCRTLENEAGQKQAKSKCFSCLPDLGGCIRSSPMTFCARRIPSLRSDHGFITIENLIAGRPPINDEDGGFITIEKGGVGSRSRRPPSDHLANTDDDDESGGPEDEQPCLMAELDDDDDDDDEGVENEFLKMLEENDLPWKKEAGKSLSAELDLDSLIKEAEIELKKAARAWNSGTGAALLEKEEHEELTRRWGSNERHSSPGGSGLRAFGSPL
ncbi:hypothetical protein MUK42_07927 [Musa troglodytarum]|uniref:C2 NT-type domain-containing protein n=1 Tax=Musa troglodytarum TaxID=320322 RepID=A0A9E7ED76_9LILI|nr:hypothetical protein MUK42_07927 [Musa troglodytarum]